MNVYNERYFRPITMNIVEEDGKIWMALLDRNGICEVDAETHQAKIIHIFEDEPITKQLLYNYVEKVDNNLVFAPAMAKKIAVYNLENNSLIYIPLKETSGKFKQIQEEVKFWNIIRYKQNVYLLGYSYPAIVKINIRQMEIVYITDWVEEVEKNIEEGDYCGYFSDGHVISGELALIPVGCMNAVLELNLKTDCTKLKRLDVSMKGIGGLSSVDKEHIWLVGKGEKTNQLVCWNWITDEINDLFLMDEDENMFDPFYAPVCTSSKIFLLPISASYVYEFNLDTKYLKINDVLKKKQNLLWSCYRVLAPRKRKDILIFLDGSDLKWIEYNMCTDEKKSYSVSFNLDEKSRLKYFESVYLEMMKNKTILSEMKIPFKYFVNKIAGTSYADDNKDKVIGYIGNTIYNQIM